MGNLNTSATSYPATLDTTGTLADGAGIDQIVAAHINGPTGALVAIETELGTLPKGSAADLKTRLSVALNNSGTLKADQTSAFGAAVIVANGGTGITSATAYGIICGGTTVTGNFQVASPTVAAGAVLTSNGPGVLPSFATVTGVLKAGTALNMNPIAVSTLSWASHGLATTPTYVKVELECLTADVGWAVGDTLSYPPYLDDSGRGLNVNWTATSVSVVAGGALLVVNRSTFGVGVTTSANWKLSITPYAIT